MPTSPCPDKNCMSCVTPQLHGFMSSQIPQKHVYYPGKILVVASISVHKPGQEPFSCGVIDSQDGAQMVEAFLYVLKQINDADIFPSWVDIGGVVLDDCASADRAISGMTGLQSGSIRVMSTDDVLMDSDSIVAYVGGHNDPILSALSQLTTKLSVPLLSYRATNSDIRDSKTYPLLAGIVPDVIKQVDVIVALLQQMKWFYIQVLYVNDEYGRDAFDVFKRTTSKHNICIGSSGIVDENMDVVSHLRETPEATVVVTFMHNVQYSSLVSRLNDTKAYKEFVFVTGMNWRDMDNVVKNYRDATHGFITSKFKDTVSSGFQAHLRNIKPSTYTQNPWFKEWYQEINNCYFDNIESGRYPNRCTDIPINESPNFELNDQTIHIMNAMYSITWGMDSTLTHYCGLGYDRLCTKYIEADNKEQLLYQNILDVWFNDDTMTAHYFEDRSGSRPIVIMNVKHGSHVEVSLKSQNICK